MKSLNIKNSLAWFERAKATVPAATQTFSKGYTQFSFGVSPVFLSHASGCTVWDVDDNAYVDLPSGLGPVILGHNYERMTAYMTEQLRKGIAFSMPHFREVEVAERIRSLIPFAEMTRYGKNGSDVTAGAVRAARAYTGRDIVACCGYHGWQDWFIGSTTRDKGVPKAVKDLTRPFTYNDIRSLEKIFAEHPGQVACVIMEPVGIVAPENDFLKKVAELSRRNGAVLVFDECWTGFRFSMTGGAGYFSVTPDLACYGKAIGNGFPISVVSGRAEIMKEFDEIFFSFTFGGDALGLAAADFVIQELARKPVIETIWKNGNKLVEGIRGLIEKYGLGKWLYAQGYAPRSFTQFKNDQGEDWWELKSLAQQEMHLRGVLYGGYHIPNFAWDDGTVDKIIRAYDETFDVLNDAIRKGEVNQRLRGQVVQPVFRRP